MRWNALKGHDMADAHRCTPLRKDVLDLFNIREVQHKCNNSNLRDWEIQVQVYIIFFRSVLKWGNFVITANQYRFYGLDIEDQVLWYIYCEPLPYLLMMKASLRRLGKYSSKYILWPGVLSAVCDSCHNYSLTPEWTWFRWNHCNCAITQSLGLTGPMIKIMHISDHRKGICSYWGNADFSPGVVFSRKHQKRIWPSWFGPDVPFVHHK